MIAPDNIDSLCRDLFSALDIQFATLVCRNSREPSELFWAAALASHAVQGGHVCIDLAAASSFLVGDRPIGSQRIEIPPVDEWMRALRRMEHVVGSPGAHCPLILDDAGRLYLHRYWKYENTFREWLRHRAAVPVNDIDSATVQKSMDRYFGSARSDDTDWQQIACAVALLKRLCIISGGPGTGKTTTVAKILTLLIEQQNGAPIRIAVAAQTGKAAARILETLVASRAALNLPDSVVNALPDSAHTIHRLIGYVPNVRPPAYHRDRPLPYDVIVIDEASMLDLPLITKLVLAVADTTRIVFLGDKDQLASVQPGSVFGDICGTGQNNLFSPNFTEQLHSLTGVTISQHAISESAPPLQDCIVSLSRNYRFATSSGIYQLGAAIAAGDAAAAGTHLEQGLEGIDWRTTPIPDRLASELKPLVSSGFRRFVEASSTADKFAGLQEFRVLCALRKGPYGSKHMNHIIEDLLRVVYGTDTRDPWYPGRPIMIMQNDYDLQLYNGDIGIVAETVANEGQKGVVFQTSDGGSRWLSPSRLPVHQTCYAMTIHKSQGSEFDRVVLVLPDRVSPVLTRELLYTGITRARSHVTLFASEAIIRSTTAAKVMRFSGLLD